MPSSSSSSSKATRCLPIPEYELQDIPDDPNWSDSPLSFDDDGDEQDDSSDCEEREWTKEEKLLYFRSWKESKGFDVPKMPDNGMCGGLERLSKCFLSQDYIRECADAGIKDFNSQNGTDFEFVEVEKACQQIVCGAMVYLTLKVRPRGMPSDCPTTSIQARVLYGIGENNITSEFVRYTPEGK